MKILSILFAVLLMAGTAFADVTGSPSALNVTYIDGSKAPLEEAGVECRLVRYGHIGAHKCGATLNSGDAVVWDTVSMDGTTISAAVTILASQSVYVAGVLITDINSADTSGFNFAGDNWGYMATSGYCLARLDSASIAGHPLVIAAEGTVTNGLQTTQEAPLSQDIGVCLESPSADGLAPVILSY